MSNNGPTGLTVVALVWREIEHIGPCFRSLQPLLSRTGAETLIVLDDEADEATEAAARAAADRVVRSRFVNYSSQRNRALELSETNWVFFIDIDERCTPALAREIAETLTTGDCAGYRVPRRNVMFAREVRHTGWWPDYQIRLLRRAGARYDEAREVHEVPVLSGPLCDLREPLIHLNYRTWGQFLRKQRAYAPLEAAALYAEGIRARPRSLFGQPLRELKRRLVDYHGYRDGLLGLALSLAMAAYRADVYRRLWLLQRSKRT
ncbi:MAG TPA: glycosyltransferase family 2 protein [Chloroflexia bacterium]|nr:glycosyltransferase family 2 protein [Chloroflexia bacterium]